MSRDAASIFRIRPYAPDVDLSPLARLLEAAEVVDQDGDDISEEVLSDQLSWPGHDPIRDRWVVEAPDSPETLIGWCAVFKMPHTPRADLAVRVHPGWRGRGIGSELLARAIERARERGATSAAIYANVRNPTADGFLRRRGWLPVSAYTAMRWPADVADVAAESAALPAGYTMRTYAQAPDESVLLEAINRCYEGLWGHNIVSADDLARWLPTMPAEGIFLTFAPDGRIAGICRAEMSDRLSARRGASAGLIDAPGVVPEHRSDGLYRPLVLTTLAWLQSQHPAGVELESWGDEPATLALYGDLGFIIERQQASYRLDLS
jgi:mycothiol synthase